MIYDISSYQEGLDISTLEDLEGVIIRAGWETILNSRTIQQHGILLNNARPMASLWILSFQLCD